MYCLQMAARPTNPNFMNGVPELLILHLLQHSEMYGYELVQAIRDRTGESIALGEGVVYPVLHNLEHDGAVTAKRKPVNGRSRIYYSLTPTGLRRLSNLSATWTSLTATIHQVLTGNPNEGHHARTLTRSSFSPNSASACSGPASLPVMSAATSPSSPTT